MHSFILWRCLLVFTFFTIFMYAINLRHRYGDDESLEYREVLPDWEMVHLYKKLNEINVTHLPNETITFLYNHLQTKTVAIVKTTESTSTISHVVLTNKSLKICQNFRYDNPSHTDLSKLNNAELRFVEYDTDPLYSSAKCDEESFLLIVVLSKPSNFERRRSIRATWASNYVGDAPLLKEKKIFQNKQYINENVVRVVFVLGVMEFRDDIMQEVWNETRDFHDIVLGSSIDSYKNLTLKTRLALKWSQYECKSEFLLKTDDDVYINVVPLVEWLKERPNKDFYSGWCNFNSPVNRNVKDKWYVSYDDYRKEIYPGYCLGGGYVLSFDAAKAILKESYGRKIFPMEDLYIGLIANEIKNITIFNAKKHFNLQFVHFKEDCKMNQLFLAHRLLNEGLFVHLNRSRYALQNCDL